MQKEKSLKEKLLEHKQQRALKEIQLQAAKGKATGSGKAVKSVGLKPSLSSKPVAKPLSTSNTQNLSSVPIKSSTVKKSIPKLKIHKEDIPLLLTARIYQTKIAISKIQSQLRLYQSDKQKEMEELYHRVVEAQEKIHNHQLLCIKRDGLVLQLNELTKKMELLRRLPLHVIDNIKRLKERLEYQSTQCQMKDCILVKDQLVDSIGHCISVCAPLNQKLDIKELEESLEQKEKEYKDWLEDRDRNAKELKELEEKLDEKYIELSKGLLPT